MPGLPFTRREVPTSPPIQIVCVSPNFSSAPETWEQSPEQSIRKSVDTGPLDSNGGLVPTPSIYPHENATAAISAAATTENLLAASHRRWRLSLRFVVVTSLCLFTVCPSVTLWLLAWDAGSKGLTTVLGFGEQSLEDVAEQLRASLLSRSMESVNSLIDSTESVMNGSVLRFIGEDTLVQGSSRANLSSTFGPQLLHAGYTIAENGLMLYYGMNLWSRLTPGYHFQAQTDHSCRANTYIRLGFNFETNALTDTMYFLDAFDDGPINESRYDLYYVNQTNGHPRGYILSLAPAHCEIGPIGTYPHPQTCQWHQNLLFSVNMGVPALDLICQLPFADHQALVILEIRTNLYTLSSFLRSLLFESKERLFLTFRNRDGYMLAASHGKFYSHSDVDYSKINPLIDPPPVHLFQRFCPLNSTDSTIRVAGELLIGRFHAWDAIPATNLVCSINGEPYWVSTDHITSSMGLTLQLYLLVDRASRMGLIERSERKTLDDIQSTNTRLIILLSFVVLTAVLIALVISFLLTRSLDRLAGGMDSLSTLEFQESAVYDIQSRYSEVAKCEVSFVALSRGLKAFIKYVPRDVVKMMLSGEMVSENIMSRRLITILFSDIVGFTEVCEKIRPQALMQLTTEYLQSMCECIVSSNGVLDKFIGDCIMAIWNAPATMEGHEAAACGAALDMQTRLVELWSLWKHCEVPNLRFRVGINTDRVLVGNYGCDFRINYTCLGDGVNLASRLESTNTHFGTVVLVSASTKSGSEHAFRFRKIGRITVPGKAQVVTIYEPVYRLQPSANAADDDDFSQAGSFRFLNPLLQQFSFPPAAAPSGEPMIEIPTLSTSAISPKSATAESIPMKLESEKLLYHWEKVPKEA